MRSLILIAAAALAVAACKPQAADENYNVNSSVTAPTCGIATNTLADEKTLFSAETAYNVAADAYVRLDATGKIPANIKAAVRPKMIDAYAALKVARQAYNLGQTCNLLTAVATVKQLSSDAKALLPAK